MGSNDIWSEIARSDGISLFPKRCNYVMHCTLQGWIKDFGKWGVGAYYISTKTTCIFLHAQRCFVFLSAVWGSINMGKGPDVLATPPHFFLFSFFSLILYHPGI